jgi:Uma2 family endonuclease
MTAYPKLSEPKIDRRSPQEFLLWEEQQPQKYEYEYGEVMAMTGGTLPHNEVAVNLIALLKNHLRGKGCRILGGDAKVMIREMNLFYYPDVVVTCDPRDRFAREYVSYPCLIVEVISPSTEGRDRGIKFRNYSRLETLSEYVLIDPDRPNLDIFRRNHQTNNWEFIPTNINEDINKSEVYLSSVDLTLRLSDLYENIQFLEEISE